MPWPGCSAIQGLRGGNGFALLLGLRLIVEGSIGDGAGDGIEHGLKQADNRKDLAWSHAIDQFVRLLPRIGCG
jgi:hypothetical protein